MKNHSNKKINLFLFQLCLFLLFPIQLFPQSKYEKKLSMSEWIAEMKNCKKNRYILENAEIYFDFYKDSLHSYTYYSSFQKGSKSQINKKHINTLIYIRNCKLPDNSSSVNHLVFHKNVTFAGCQGASQLIFNDCTFDQGIDLRSSELGLIQFENCSVLQRVVISELQARILSFTNCILTTDKRNVRSVYSFGDENENRNYQYLFRVYQIQNNIQTFFLSDCKFLPSNVIPVMLFSGGKYDFIGFDKINFTDIVKNHLIFDL